MLAERSLEDIVDKIYWVAGETTPWNEVACDIAKASGAVSCSLQIRHGTTTRILGAAGYQDFQPELYELNYARKDVRARVLLGLPPNEPHLLHHHMSQEEFLRSDYYNEFFRHITNGHWSAAAWLTFEPEMRLGIGIHRAKGSDPEDEAQLQVLRYLGPHLRRAGRLYMKLNDIELRLGQLSAALDHVKQPAILVGSNARVMVMNSAAEALFAPPHALGIDAGGKIVLKSAIETRNLHHAIQVAAGQPAHEDAKRSLEIVVNNGDEGNRMALSVVPLTAGRGGPLGRKPDSVMLLLKEFAMERVSLDALQQAFGLSPAETRLTALLANGLSLRQASERLGVSYWTVMTQVKSCYQKTGTHRQAELVSLALRVATR